MALSDYDALGVSAFAFAPITLVFDCSQ